MKGTTWSVAGISRSQANVVSTHQGGPAYGGTPSDAAVKAAIADLRARGLKVTLYPFVMMDIPHGNGLTDSYGLEAGQPAYPWRGRVTCHPAPGVAGSPDGMGAAAGQVASFMANGYREMILHYAQLAEDAGGVDALLIGSEMRGLTWVRSGTASFPFVDALRGLAADVRAIVGNGTKITYAADWSEYSGLQPVDAPGDKIFHLDPLWADANIDAIGIDNYMPLADWRDGEGHADAAVAGSVYDLDYLKGNIAGGEGFDWYYATDADREAQVRTPIADGAHGEDWVWRYKDLAGFWSRPHHNRIGGVRAEAPTDWVPGSKPIWLTEFGCGAVDKGANAPNVFGDPKSAEDARPPFSGGTPDPLMQRQALRACHHYWRAEGAHNPVSPVYGGPMLDADRIYLWCWDARPYPAFPGMPEVWSDAANYETGHWLNGRLGSAGADELLAAMARDFGVPVAGVDARPPLVRGLGIEAVTSLRDASGSLVEAAGLAVRDTDAGIVWRAADTRTVTAIAPTALVAGDGPLTSRKRGDPAEKPARLTLNYFDRDRDYQTASVLAVSPSGERNAGAETGLVIDPAEARTVAEAVLRAMRRADDTLEAVLPPSMLRLEAGDVIDLSGQADGPFVVDAVRDGAARAVSASAHGGTVTGTVVTLQRRVSQVAPPIAAEPVIAVAHLPSSDGATELVASGFAEPWPGAISLRDGSGRELGRLNAPGALGELTQGLAEGSGGVWDRTAALEVLLYGGHLASADPLAVLASANRLAIRTDAGHWEVIGFERAELAGPSTYRLTGLLRGLDGTRSGAASGGNRVMVLDRNCVRLAVPRSALGDTRTLRAYAGARDAEGTELGVDVDIGAALPLAPVHLRAERDAATGDVALSWIRRSRVEGNAWTYADVPLDFAPERYRISILNGAAMVRTMEVSAAGFVYPAAEQIADFGALPATFGFSVEQICPVLGAGHKAQGVFP